MNCLQTSGPFQNTMTQTEKQEHSEQPVHVNMPFDVKVQLKKGLDVVKSNLESENKILKQKLEESRKESKILAQELEESRKEAAEMKEQNRILNEYLEKALDRENHLKKELDAIKNRTKLEIQDIDINEEALEALINALKSSEPQQNPSASSSGNYCSLYSTNTV